jgi:hypothetical protein
MGCCTSTDSNAQAHVDANKVTTNAPSSALKKGEDKIELAFKAKRANVFVHGIDLQNDVFVLRNIPKPANQVKTISKFL